MSARAPETESFVNFFRPRTVAARDFLAALDKNLFTIARMRGVAALESDLPARLEEAGDRLVELAFEVGDLGQQADAPTTVEAVRSALPLYTSAYPAVDASDPPMPTFATRRVLVAAYMVYTEALLMRIQTLYEHWSFLTRPLLVRDGEVLAANRPPPATEASLFRWVRTAAALAAKLRGLDAARHEAAFDSDALLRQTFLGLSASVCSLAESMCNACTCLLDAQTKTVMNTTRSSQYGTRLEGRDDVTLGAVLNCALGLRRACVASMPPCAYAGFNARMLRWRLDVTEMEHLYTVLFWALVRDGKRLEAATKRWRDRGPTVTAHYNDVFVALESARYWSCAMQVDPFDHLAKAAADAAAVALPPKPGTVRLDLPRRARA